MSAVGEPRRDRPNRAVVGLVVLLVVAGGALVYRVWPDAAPVSTVPPPAARVAAAPTVLPPKLPEPKPAATPVAPSFDVVRVGPQGRAVIAGRAESNAEVTVRDGDRILGRTRADAQGQFVFTPDGILAPGGRELTLSARGADGNDTPGTSSVFLAIPAPATQAATQATEPAAPLAVLLPRNAEPPRVLDAPAGRKGKLGLDSVDYAENGDIRFAGSARPDAPVRLYVDNQPVGDAKAGPDGQWIMVPSRPVAPGVHRLRVDQLGPDGRVVSRIELPIQRTAPGSALAGDLTTSHAVVQPGQNLWRIARQSYGQGTRYFVIYQANREQIRDPNKIYPGQIFEVPPRS